MKKFSIALSLKDEGVPEDYIGVQELFSQPKYALPGWEESWCIGPEKLKKMRYDTYQDVKKRFVLCGAADFAKFWNGNLDAINSLGINRFFNIYGFGEIASAMICFQTPEKNKKSGKTRKMISWGVKRTIYREFYKSFRDAARNGTERKPVSLYDSRKNRSGNIFKLPDVRLTFDDQVVKIKRNAIYTRFEFWCKVNEISKRDGVYKALSLLVEQNPVKGLKSLGAYERKCDLDYTEVLIPDPNTEKTVSATVFIPKKIHKKMREIIERYNRDPENIGEPTMTVGTYIAQAVDLLNRKAPLKYSDPEAYEDYVKAKKAEKYNEFVSNL